MDGHERYAYSERNGVRLIEIEAKLENDSDPSTGSSWDFEKAVPHSTGWGLQNDVILNCMQNKGKRPANTPSKIQIQGR